MKRRGQEIAATEIKYIIAQKTRPEIILEIDDYDAYAWSPESRAEFGRMAGLVPAYEASLEVDAATTAAWLGRHIIETQDDPEPDFPEIAMAGAILAGALRMDNDDHLALGVLYPGEVREANRLVKLAGRLEILSSRLEPKIRELMDNFENHYFGIPESLIDESEDDEE